MIRSFVILLLINALSLQSMNASEVTAPDYPFEYLYQELPFEMPRLHKPTFPDNSVCITDFGGVGNGIDLNTKAFAAAMEALSNYGGGTLVVPAGVWFTGPIVFKSNINLHLKKGSLILFTPDINAYPIITTSFEGLSARRCQSPISGIDLSNIAITGYGAINGSGEAWRPLKRFKVTDAHWKQATTSGGAFRDKDFWFPSEGALKGQLLTEKHGHLGNLNMTDAEWEEVKHFLRPVMVSFIGCKNILLEGVLFENSPSWNIHPLMCENIIIDGVFIRNPSFAQNGDGLDLESCRNAIVINSVLDVGDDAICIKSGKDEEGRRRAMSTENVIVDNCTVFKGHGGFVVGSEMSGGVRNIYVSNCNFIGTNVGLRFKSNRGRGGVVENIYATNISMLNIVYDSFLFDLYYGSRYNPAETTVRDVQPVTEATPVFRNIYVRNLVSHNAQRAMFFNGLPEMKISNINVENSSFTAETGAVLSESADITFKNVHVSPKNGPAILLNNVHHFKADGFSFPSEKSKAIDIRGVDNQNINFVN